MRTPRAGATRSGASHRADAISLFAKNTQVEADVVCFGACVLNRRTL
jgi:hypothetical protein